MFLYLEAELKNFISMCPVTKEEYLMEAQAHIAPWITCFLKKWKAAGKHEVEK